MSARLRIHAAGPHVSVQDGGRRGFLRFGVPQSGPMDRTAFQAANLALGQDAGRTGIEISLGGLVLDCLEGSVDYAVAGGGFRIRRNGRDHVSWHRARLCAGDRIEVRPGPWGSWCYLAFAGALQVPLWLGSASTHSLSGFGGGRLTAGRELLLEELRPDPLASARLPVPVWARPSGLAHVTIGPQEDCFSPAVLARLLTMPFRVTPAFDRMGMRLAGPDLTPEGALAIPSGPVARGAVQIAGDGVASVLMADHQTTGGYPRIATILDADLDALAQMRPNESLHFCALTPAQATGFARTRRQAVARYLAGIARLGGVVASGRDR